MKRILINAANLHVGGGVQVAASFILELSEMLNNFTGCQLVVYASTAVDANLSLSGLDRSNFHNYHIVNVRGLEALKPKNAKKFYGFDLVFTIFGPLYLPRRIKNHIM